MSALDINGVRVNGCCLPISFRVRLRQEKLFSTRIGSVTKTFTAVAMKHPLGRIIIEKLATLQRVSMSSAPPDLGTNRVEGDFPG